MSESTGKSSVSSLKSICQAALDALPRSVEGVSMAVIASDNGFPLASINLDSREGRQATALASALGDAANRTCAELKLKGMQAAVLEAEDGLVVYRLVENRVLSMLLLVVIGPQTDGSYAQWSVRRCAAELAAALNELADSAKP